MDLSLAQRHSPKLRELVHSVETSSVASTKVWGCQDV